MSKLKDNIDLFKLNKIQLIHKINSLELRVEELEDTIKDELYKSQKQNAKEKLEYLYFECFGKNEHSVDTILNQFLFQMKRGNHNMIRKLYDIFK